MKAGIKYLRNLGQIVRSQYKLSDQKAKEGEDTPSNPSNSKTKYLRVCNTDRRLTLHDFQNADTPIKLNAEEQDYIDLTKEYRQYDEKRFKAFQLKCLEERRRKSLKVNRNDAQLEIQPKQNFEIKLRKTEHQPNSGQKKELPIDDDVGETEDIL